MDDYKGTYSFFRYPQEKMIGFSPFLAYLNVNSGLLKTAFKMGRGDENIEKIIDDIFYLVEGNIFATINISKPIYVIAKCGLLNEFIISVMLGNIRCIENKSDDIIKFQGEEYINFLNEKCNSFDNECECENEGRCSWDYDNKCNVKDDTSDIKKNKKQFPKRLVKFFESIKKCMENEGCTPYYLLGLVLMSYWHLIRNSMISMSEKEYLDMFMNDVKKFIDNSSDDDYKKIIDNIDEILTSTELIPEPKPLIMIQAKIPEKFPACFETVVNDFFNIYFYDKETKKFILPDNCIDSLKNHYKNINDNNLDYTSFNVINNFVKLTKDINGINYKLGDHEIKSSYENFMNIISYFLNYKNLNLVKILKTMNIDIINFEKEVLSLKIKETYIDLNIKPGHSFSERKFDAKLNIQKDNLFEIFRKFILNSFQIGSSMNVSFVELYNYLNNDSYINNDLPFYELQLTGGKKIVDNHFQKLILTRNGDYNFNIEYINTIYIQNIIKKPNWFDDLKNLRNLNIERTHIYDIDFVNSFQKLKILNLSELTNVNKILNLNLPLLEELRIEECKIINIPEDIGKLKNLKIIEIVDTELEELPNSICELKELKELILNENKIKKIPERIGDMENLEVLNLDENKIKKLPLSLGSLISLKILRLEDNEIENVDVICDLINLEKIYLSNNKINELPLKIGNLKKIKKFSASNNGLESLPKSFKNLKDMISLKLDRNKFKKIPKSIKSFENLKVIVFDANKIRVIPDFIGDLYSLKHIEFSNNNISVIPESMGNIDGLEVLFLDNNNIEEIPEIFDKLTKINYLNFKKNAIKKIPNSFKYLNKLEVLNMNNNKIKILPVWLLKLRNIENIFLMKNNIEKIPKISKIKKLKLLSLENNPVKEYDDAKILMKKNILDI